MTGERYYVEGDPDTEVTPSQLKRMARWRQRQYVLEWFGRNFEDPAMDTPYEGKEGGYQYIWGGPYNAREELWREFEGILPEDRIEALADELERRGIEWAPGPDHPDRAPEYDDEPPADDDGEPDFEHIIADLEIGISPTYGSEVEKQQREDLLAHIAALENELASLRPEHGGMGHNRPPADEETEAAAEIAGAILADTDAIKNEIAKVEPDALTVAKSASRLQRSLRWLAGKGETAAEEFAKAFGKAAGTAAGALVVTLVGAAVLGMLGLVADWLGFVTWGL
jgi:hypothetical protein